MRKVIHAAVTCLMAALLLGGSQFIMPIFEPPVSTVTTFTPLHLFFMSPSGSDAANGQTPATAWQTPNHAVSCGDVILAAAGDYTHVNSNNGLSSWGTVSNCPSTSGGIDGTGGIYFAVVLCAGADLEACTFNRDVLTIFDITDLTSNNWSMQGWKLSSNCDNTQPSSSGKVCGGGDRAFQMDGAGTPIHHFAFINNVCVNVGSCFHGDDGGCTPPCTHGVDYVAAVGNIAVKGSLNAFFPEAAFDCVGMFPLDTNAGTHCYLYNNYTWNNNCGIANVADGGGLSCVFDSESFMFDTWDAHAYSNTGVVANNISWNAQRFCVNFFTGNNPPKNVITPTMKAYNNTCFHNELLTASSETTSQEFSVQITGLPWTITVNNNIAYQPLANSPAPSPGGGAILYAALNGGGGTNPNVTWGTGVNQNVFLAAATSCAGTSGCDSGSAPFSTTAYNSNAVPNGIITNPNFNNTSDLLTNRSGNTINCAGFVNTTLCMGYNPNTQVLTNPSVIYDLTATCAQCGGKGFQLPSTTCSNSGDLATDYPVWLKGMVYLHASGFTAGAVIIQQHDLATTKCGL